MDEQIKLDQKEEDGASNEIQNVKPPAVLGNFLQPGFPLAKVFSVFFMENSLVFAKTGSGGTNAAGTMAASLGGFNPTALIASGVGAIVDQHTDENRSDKTGQLAAFSAAEIVAENKRNFMIPFDAVKSVTINGPNFAGEVRVIITSDKSHKFRINKQSKDSADYIKQVFADFLPGKVSYK